MRKIYSVPFGADFIGELKKIILKDNSNLSRTAIVFSGKRPSLYLKKVLAEGQNQPFYPPRCFSADEFIDYITRKKFYDYINLEYTDAVWFLYQVVRSLNVFNERSFAKKGFGEFFYWGKHILDFINQLDIENVSNIRLHALEGNAEIGYDVPQSANELLMNISIVRSRFHEILKENRCFTIGYKYLCALELIGEEPLDEFDRIYFAGLFALSHTEREIIRSIWLKDKGEIILEGNPDNWHILKTLITHFNAEIEYAGCTTSKPEHIRIHPAFDAHSEVLKIQSILNDVKSNRTAVVLPLSESLFPLLTFAIDRTDKKFNISLRYPFARTSVFDLIEQVINAQLTKRVKGFYSAKNYLHVILNPFVKNLNLDNDLRELLLHIESSIKGETYEKGLLNKPFIKLDEIENDCGPKNAAPIKEIHRIFFRNFEGVNNLLEIAENLETLLEQILSRTSIRSYILSGEIFKTAFEFLEKLKQARFSGEIFSFDDKVNKKTLYDFTLNYLKTIDMPFETKPIEEIEIIGMLETRNLSFDTVIMLDVNEGIMPQPKKVGPLVPMGVYESLGIPTPEYNEEIYRYHFYRLIGSSKNVHLLYIDAEDKQRSRYIEQIIWEEEKNKKALNAIPVESSLLKINLKTGDMLPEFKKSTDIIGQLKNKTYSPSSVDDYITCPVLFYFKHILNFEQKKELSGDIDALDRGTIIHRILFDTFEAFKNKEITVKVFNDILDRMAEAAEERFRNKVVTGDYYLFKKLSTYKLESFLRKNIMEAGRPFIVRHIEETISNAVIEAGGFLISLKGRIDRIDYYPDNGEYIIIDYKTGGSKQYPQSIVDKTDFGSIDDIHKRVNSFQLPVYVYLFNNAHQVPLRSINAKLVLLKSNEEELFFKGSQSGREAELEQYMQGVKTVLTDMLDMSKPFKPFDDEACAECTFKNLCHV
jgi:CRISPR/Cas system-associated exonuclease Cas4 (RecB family)